MLKQYKNYKIVIIRKKIKNTYIRIKDNNLIITTNQLTPNIFIDNLIKNNYKQIDKMITKIEKKQEKEQDFYIFGKKYDLIFNEQEKNILIKENEIITPTISKLNKYLDLLIKETFSEHLEFWYKKFEENIPIPNLKIRKMKTRWGVCNTKNHNITLNYYLHKYELECLDYVIVHELSHFIEGNHSKKFWKVVEKYYPNYKTTRKKLRS